MAIQPATYQKRLRKHSELSPCARLVATTIAQLRYEGRIAAHEPLPLTLPQLAAECGMSSRNTARRWLEECLASGWVIGRAVYRDGRQQPNEYFIADPTDEPEVNRLTSVIARNGQLLRSSGRPISVKRLDTVLRSKNKSGSIAAPQRRMDPDEQGAPQQPAHTATTAPPMGATLAAPTAVVDLRITDDDLCPHHGGQGYLAAACPPCRRAMVPA